MSKKSAKKPPKKAADVVDLFDEGELCSSMEESVELRDIVQTVMSFNMNVMVNEKEQMTNRLFASKNILKAIEVLDNIDFGDNILADSDGETDWDK
ncbi:MAG: hypothetical protein WC889_08140 [Myxococcota bacterium]|jgi:hypothetical protein